MGKSLTLAHISFLDSWKIDDGMAHEDETVVAPKTQMVSSVSLPSVTSADKKIINTVPGTRMSCNISTSRSTATLRDTRKNHGNTTLHGTATMLLNHKNELSTS